MISHHSMFTIKLIAACALLTGATASLMAQPVYRIVGADGKVTFSDKPPAASPAKVTTTTTASGGGIASSSLPFELRQIAQKYPVTLYTADNCGPCQSARSMLTTRGIPFTEKTIKTAQDSQALQRLSGESALPFATIGGQQLKGFSDAEWTQFLNAAGYPAASVLPSSYRQAPATPLVAVTAAPTSTTSAQPAATEATPAPSPRPAASNQSGIRF